MKEWRYSFILAFLLLELDLVELPFIHTLRFIAGVRTHSSIGSEIS